MRSTNNVSRSCTEPWRGSASLQPLPSEQAYISGDCFVETIPNAVANFMIARFIFSIVSYFTLTTCYSQVSLDNDTSYRPLFHSTLKEIDSTFNLSTNADFELRFWSIASKTMERRLFTLTFKGDKVKGRLFKRTIHQKDTLLEIPVNQDNLTDLWEKLKRHNLLFIPDASVLRNKKGEEANLFIHDGIRYSFELITPGRKRSFSYTCPRMHSAEYKKIVEFKQVAKIVQILEEYIGVIGYRC